MYNTCLECEAPLYLNDENMCVGICPKGYNHNEELRTCEECVGDECERVDNGYSCEGIELLESYSFDCDDHERPFVYPLKDLFWSNNNQEYTFSFWYATRLIT